MPARSSTDRRVAARLSNNPMRGLRTGRTRWPYHPGIVRDDTTVLDLDRVSPFRLDGISRLAYKSSSIREDASRFDQGRLNANLCDSNCFGATIVRGSHAPLASRNRPTRITVARLGTTCSSPVRTRDRRLIRPSSGWPAPGGFVGS